MSCTLKNELHCESWRRSKPNTRNAVPLPENYCTRVALLGGLRHFFQFTLHFRFSVAQPEHIELHDVSLTAEQAAHRGVGAPEVGVHELLDVGTRLGSGSGSGPGSGSGSRSRSRSGSGWG